MIVDAFLFHREHEMLEFRMRLLYPHVDKIVIVEANRTFSGLDKPFCYEQNQQAYSWAADKIVYFKVSRPPSDDFWQNEYAQRGRSARRARILTTTTFSYWETSMKSLL